MGTGCLVEKFGRDWRVAGVWRGLLLVCFGVCFAGRGVGVACAQGAAGAQAVGDTGYVTGHVVCDDTQRPARLAFVRLVPVPAGMMRGGAVAVVPAGESDGSDELPMQTDANGTFVAAGVKPGRYIVRVDRTGYLTPLMGFSLEELRAPDEAVRQRMSRELEFVDVRAHAETRVEVTLHRGATMSGTMRFDDGSPAVGVGVQLFRKDSDGAWKNARLPGAGQQMSGDVDGHFAVEGVPAGSYLVEASLALTKPSLETFGVKDQSTQIIMMHVSFVLSVYSGDVFRRRDATPLKVESAGVYGGNDVVIPLSKLHRVSGAVLAEGHAVNGGTVSLLYADDGTEVASVDISEEDRQFVFPYVPEGKFVLRVTEAREVNAAASVTSAASAAARGRRREQTVRSYGKAEQPLLVEGDVEGVGKAVAP